MTGAPQREPSAEPAICRQHYTTICSSAPSEYLVALALRNRELLVERNVRIVHRNLTELEAFFTRHREVFDWVKPVAGPIAFPRFNQGGVQEFCADLVQTKSVLLLPGSVYDEPRHIRFGFGSSEPARSRGTSRGVPRDADVRVTPESELRLDTAEEPDRAVTLHRLGGLPRHFPSQRQRPRRLLVDEAHLRVPKR